VRSSLLFALVAVALAPAGCGGRSQPGAGTSPKPRTTPTWRGGTGRARSSDPAPLHDAVPVLMYHAIAKPPPGTPYPDLFVSPDDFARQIAWLAAHGYRAVTLRRVYDNWHQGTWLPAHPIVVSFDDGYRSQYTAALPILRARHWPGVLNLTVDHEDDFWGLPPRLVRALIDAGWELDSHTLTHPDLTGLDDADLHHEVAGSRTALRHQFGVPVDFFCYPSGRFDERAVAVVKAAGYLGATSTRYGLARPGDLYWLARVRVNGSDGLAGFVSKLRALVRR
jgi:peptidoglycan/xylan/chitin deacetylase (PgdA/CDA1 family)